MPPAFLSIVAFCVQEAELACLCSLFVGRILVVNFVQRTKAEGGMDKAYGPRTSGERSKAEGESIERERGRHTLKKRELSKQDPNREICNS